MTGLNHSRRFHSPFPVLDLNFIIFIKTIEFIKMLFTSILYIIHAFHIYNAHAEFHTQRFIRQKLQIDAVNWRDSWGDGCDWYEHFDPTCSSDFVSCCSNEGFTAKTICPHCLNANVVEDGQKQDGKF